MLTVTLSRLKERIGDMGLPGVVWPVYSTKDDAMRCFYNREKAEAFVVMNPMWFVGTQPIQMQDASSL
jgi:hypothetical protein